MNTIYLSVPQALVHWWSTIDKGQQINKKEKEVEKIRAEEEIKEEQEEESISKILKRKQFKNQKGILSIGWPVAKNRASERTN